MSGHDGFCRKVSAPEAFNVYMKLFPVSLIIFGLIPSLPAANVKVHDHLYPLALEARGTNWRLGGTEHFRYKRIFSVFTAALYHQENGGGRRLTFTYTRSLKADDLRDRAMRTLTANNDPETLAEYAAWTDGLQKAYIDVKDGDSYSITVLPEAGTWLELNGKILFACDSAAFGFWYLDIWLGDPPASDSLKQALLKDKIS